MDVQLDALLPVDEPITLTELSRRGKGGTAPERVREQLVAAQEALANHRVFADSRIEAK